MNRANYPAPLSVLEIDLDAIAGNWLLLKKRLKAGADCAAVVKADAYGLGAEKVAMALHKQGCRHFFVSHFEEALSLRAVLPTEAPIYVLHGPHGATAREFTRQGFVPVLNTLPDIEYWAETSPRAPCLVHIDTGMNRLGLGVGEAARLAADAKRLDALNIRYVMSHLACADQPAHPLNAAQREAFERLATAFKRPLRLSLANSAGIFLGEDYHFDLARPGCALYGVNPTAGANPMHGVVRLRARILQIKEIDISGTVGYGATYRISPPAKTATISVGYADGYLRSLTGGGAVYINGKKCPVIGRVSMDLIVADVSAMENTGEYAEIIGPHQAVDDVAAQAGTIGYEILTSLGKRYKRIYKGG
jgi:alanine racemase